MKILKQILTPLISWETLLSHLRPNSQFIQSSFLNDFATDNFVTDLRTQKKSKRFVGLGTPGVPAGWSPALAGAAP